MDPSELEREADKAVGAGDLATAILLLERAAAAAPANFDIGMKLSALLYARGDHSAALTWIDQALSLRPLSLSALLMKATQLHAQGKEDEAGMAYGHALAQAPEQPPAPLARALSLAQERHGAWQQRRLQAIVTAGEAAAGSPLSPRLRRFATNIVRLSEADRQGPTHYCFPELGGAGFYDRSTFPYLDRMEEAAAEISGELQNLLDIRLAAAAPYIQYSQTTPLAQWAALNFSRDWSALHLFQQGRVIEDNARLCPRTMAVLASLPQPKIPGAGPNAMLSLLAPHTHIPAHTGVTNARLVCHLPLIVPPNCWFRVGEERRAWEEGKVLVFDDTVEHEAMNGSDDLRVVLIFDIWHPDLTAIERAGVGAMVPAGGAIATM